MSILNTLRENRKRKKLTQAEVAKELGFKSTDRISRWEKGLAYPNIKNLFKLAKLYGVKAEDLYPDDSI